MSNRLMNVLLVCLLLAAPARAADAGAPVIFHGSVLFTVRVPFGPFSAEQRAQTLLARLLRLAEPAEADHRLVIAAGDTSTEILAGDTVLMVVTDADAAAEQRQRDELAAARVEMLNGALLAARLTRGKEHVILATVHAALATIAVIAVLLSLRLGRRYLRRRVEAWRSSGRLALRLQNAELVSGPRMALTMERGIAIGNAILWSLAYYAYLLAVFSFFPSTRQYGALLLNAVLVPFFPAWRALVDYLPNVGVIAVVVLVATLLIRLLRFIFDALGQGSMRFEGFHPDWSDTSYKIARFLIVAFAAVVIFPYLPGAGSPAFQAISIFLGVLFSFGSGAAISNIIAGVVLTYTRAFSVGDRCASMTPKAMCSPRRSSRPTSAPSRTWWSRCPTPSCWATT
ncbi:hypothetical protein [Rugamonas sp.]|uniref:hypothetical protein n=1 Tax=Rugamonas sp. TaxID=1926287 RepID=UPI00345C2872